VIRFIASSIAAVTFGAVAFAARADGHVSVWLDPADHSMRSSSTPRKWPPC
jgi:hypothetical protein